MKPLLNFGDSAPMGRPPLDPVLAVLGRASATLLIDKSSVPKPKAPKDPL